MKVVSLRENGWQSTNFSSQVIIEYIPILPQINIQSFCEPCKILLTQKIQLWEVCSHILCQTICNIASLYITCLSSQKCKKTTAGAAKKNGNLRAVDFQWNIGLSEAWHELDLPSNLDVLYHGRDNSLHSLEFAAYSDWKNSTNMKTWQHYNKMYLVTLMAGIITRTYCTMNKQPKYKQ